MKTLVSALFLLLLLLVQACIKAPANSRKSTVASSSTTTSTGTSVYPTFATDESLYWYTAAKYTGTITVNKNTQDVVYLRGKLVHDFLSTKDLSGNEYYRRQYCLIGNFSSTSYKQVRFRAIPITYTTSTKAVERLLRIDIPSSDDNAASCMYTAIDGYSPAVAPLPVYSLQNICTSCSGQITTSALSLYSTASSALTKIDTTSLNLSSVLLRVDLTSNSTDPSSSCSNSACSAKGYDCCISGQCVMDGTEKPNASTDLQYSQAKSDYAKNPLSFINYPNIYYVCSNIAHTPVSSGTTTTTPAADAQARIQTYMSDWKCFTDYEANGNNTFYVLKSDHTTFASSVTIATASLYDTVNCTDTYYAAEKKKLAIACGCTASDADMAVKCPNWGIVPVYKTGAAQTNANITDFTCYTPQPANPIGPITNLNVSVPNRSAPHRFFSSAGTSFDDLSGLLTTAPSTVQEGDDFYYLDEYNKVGPVNGSFNINSVLGKMTIDLTHTLPAKEVTVELGKTYILSATSGYFTPCSQCAKDSWFQTFSAHPATQRGVGLQAIGFSTSRDTYSGNSTYGNYEDTKFGRACYVPVTMLPYAHQKNTGLQTQRQNRLKTQTAYYINGYQRDWYGFNQGALIGSFDGVTWFAIGTGRRATATSTKLYLALNASFLDLADKTNTIVNIIPDNSGNIAADYDYNPDIAFTDPKQNTGATCQKYHQCSTDADCVTQLGWEYACADVSQYKTKWPVFDGDAKELVNQERTSPLFDILQSTISTTTTKRCVYRGAGSPCKLNYTNSLNDLDKKMFTCAPNFYCASLTSNKFNDQVARSPNEFDDILFGMDANVLGRPLNYVTASQTLLTEIISNIKYNATGATGLSSAESDNMGICRPGRYLSDVDVTAHSNPDSSKRTDYISQIASCNSAATGTFRFATCPAFDDTTLNYVDPNAVTSLTQRQVQNSCGAEAKNTTTGVSAFKSIEGLSLLNLQSITQPTLVQDACYRRAGSVCNTDLDCGPNKMHEDAVGTLDIKYFGGTDGEQSYWRESLICGQGTATPALGASNYYDYSLTANRCCREIGKDFTMITQGPKSIVPENVGTNENLVTDKFSYKDPQAANRYSRYTVSKELANLTGNVPKVDPTKEPAADQWRVINETGSLTCCGGGWIRKFADGSHDWKVRNRLTIDANNFTCLNFRSPLADSSYSNFAGDKVNQMSYQREYDQFCKSPDIGGCMQVTYPDSNGFTIAGVTGYSPSQAVISDPYLSTPAIGYSRINTSPSADPIDGTTPWYPLLNSDVPYGPVTYTYSPIPYDVDSRTNQAYNFFTDRTFDYGVEMYLPAYVGWDGTSRNITYINSVQIKYFYDSPLLPQVVDITNNLATAANCAKVETNPGGAPGGALPINWLNGDAGVVAGTNEGWCITNIGGRPVMNVHADSSGGNTWKYAGIVIDFKPVENARGTQVATPGNAFYYLTKLARLELLGIPQITYEPIYCNSDQTKLVPGIFKSTYANRASFEAATNAYTSFDPIASYNDDNMTNLPEQGPAPAYGNYNKKYAYQDKVDHSAVFSSKDFTCCTPLGKTTSSGARCCSGYAVTSTDGKSQTCKLPMGTDLNVYFNKFVSSEGVGDDQPGGGLIIKGTDAEVDFNAYTGEPKYRSATYDKLSALGAAYCSTGKVATGGAFGAYPPEPFSGSYKVQNSTTNLEDTFPMSIVDSVLDYQKSDENVGKIQFDSGFKWNHHYYCK